MYSQLCKMMEMSRDNENGDRYSVQILPPEETTTFAFVQLGVHDPINAHHFGPSIRDFCLIHFVEKGSMTLRVNEREYSVNAGDAFAIWPGQLSYYASSKADYSGYYWISFCGTWSDELLRRAGFDREKTPVIHLYDSEKIFEQLKQMAEKAMAAESLEEILPGVTGDMLLLMQMLIDGNRNTYPQELNVRRRAMGTEYTRFVVDVIENSYRNHISVQSLAQQIGVNRTYLTEVFKRDTGKSIKQYLIDYRLERVKNLIRMYSEWSLKQISGECGFDDPLYMSRIFKNRYGESPQEYRKHIMNTEADKKLNSE